MRNSSMLAAGFTGARVRGPRGTRRHNLPAVVDDRFYFRQLLAGRDFAKDDPVARQMVNFAYVVGERAAGEALAVDPAYAPYEIVELLAADGMTLTGVLVTHYHPDHVGGDLGGWSIAGVRELLGHPDVRAKLHVHA